MNLADPHRVRRVRWLGQAATTADGLALRSLLAQMQADTHAALGAALDDALTEALSEARNEVLTGLDRADTVHHIRRLDLRVRAPSFAALATELPQLVAHALRDALPTLPLADGETAHAAGAVPAIDTSSSIEYRQRTLAHYLLTGQLPWALGGLSHAEALASLGSAARHAADAWFAGDPALVLPAAAAMRSLAARVATLVRWLALLPDTTLARLDSDTASWGVGRGAPIMGTLAACNAASAAAPSLALELRALRLALRIDFERSGVVPTPALGRWADERQAALVAPERAALARLAATITLDGVGQPVVIKAFADAPNGLTNGPRSDHGWDVPPPRPTHKAGTSPAEAAEHGRLVPLAGLVLLHPFLPRLLDTLHLHDSKIRGPLSAAALRQTLPLLHWAATGRDEVHEFELPLIKLLLGLPPVAPLAAPLVAPLGAASAAARLEVTAVLEALIGHWPALRNTHLNGLRASFLQRNGLLQRGGGHWQLRMESASFDMLLATLPWGIRFVKLPWMDEALVVDWPVP